MTNKWETKYSPLTKQTVKVRLESTQKGRPVWRPQPIQCKKSRDKNSVPKRQSKAKLSRALSRCTPGTDAKTTNDVRAEKEEKQQVSKSRLTPFLFCVSKKCLKCSIDDLKRLHNCTFLFVDQRVDAVTISRPRAPKARLAPHRSSKHHRSSEPDRVHCFTNHVRWKGSENIVNSRLQ